jgi:hypothetical protein
MPGSCTCGALLGVTAQRAFCTCLFGGTTPKHIPARSKGAEIRPPDAFWTVSGHCLDKQMLTFSDRFAIRRSRFPAREAVQVGSEEECVDIDTASDERGLRSRPWARPVLADAPSPRLGRGEGLLIALLLSLGLWVAIGVAVNALVRTLLS